MSTRHHGRAHGTVVTQRRACSTDALLVIEAPLGHADVQRCLATLKTQRHRAALPGTLALVTTRGGLTTPRSRASPNAAFLESPNQRQPSDHLCWSTHTAYLLAGSWVRAECVQCKSTGRCFVTENSHTGAHTTNACHGHSCGHRHTQGRSP